MTYKAILFDLDGTLMPITNEDFQKVYLSSLAEKLSPYIEPKLMLNAMWQSLEVMMNDQSQKMNDRVFFKHMNQLLGKDLVETLTPEFEAYYLNEFKVLKDALDSNHEMVETISYLKNKGYDLIVATNPMFPAVAVEQRIKFSGLKVDDFKYVSNFELHSATKPNVKFYEEVLEINNLKPEECLMIGNDMQEDMVVKHLGMDGWIITDYLITNGEKDISDWSGTRQEFYKKVKEEL